MGTVGVWRDDDKAYQDFDITLVRRSEVDMLVEFLKEGFVKIPDKLYLIAPNGYGNEDVLAFYTAFINRHLGEFDVFVSESREFKISSMLWKELVSALSIYDVSNAVLAIKGIGELDYPIAALTKRTLSIFSEFINEVISPISEHELYQTTPQVRNLMWWQQPLELQERLLKYDIRSNVAQGQVPAIKTILDRAIKRFSSLKNKPIDEKFYLLSAFCIGLADRRLKARKYQTGFLLTYRALDLFFQAFALNARVMLETAGGVCYRSLPLERIYLVTTEYHLVKEGKLVSDFSRRGFIQEINSTRNQLLITHGGHFVQERDAMKFFSKAEKLVRNIEGNSRWKSISDSFFPSFSEHLEFLFCTIPDIQTYIEERSLVDLRY